jgi:hypothetical protein
MLLDFLTVFFIVAGLALLWLNLQPGRPRIVITTTENGHQSAPTQHAPHDAQAYASLIEVLQRHLSEIGPDPGRKEDNR